MRRWINRECKNGYAAKNLILGSAIIVILCGLIGFFFLQSTKISFNPEKKISREYSLLNTYRSMETDFAGSYVMRLGFFTCDSSQSLMVTEKSEELSLKSDGDSLEFVKVDMAVAAGILQDGETLVLSDAKKIRKNDFVLLNRPESFEDAGLFRVINVNYDNNRVQVTPADFDDSMSGCRDSLEFKKVSHFAGSQLKSDLILSQVSAVKFTINQGQLRRQIWPVKNLAAVESLAGIKELAILGQWSPQSEYGQRNSLIGSMLYQIIIKIDEKATVTSFHKAEKEKVIWSQYVLNEHKGDQKIPQRLDSLSSGVEPTCIVTHEFKPSTLSVDPALKGMYDNAISLKISAAVSEILNSPAIDISFSPSPGGLIHCFKHDPETGLFSPPGPGVSGVLTLQQTEGIFDTYTCAVRGRVGLSATLTYFDLGANHVKTVSCEAGAIQAPTQYRLNGYVKPSCKKSGEWTIGNSFSGSDSQVYFGNLGVDIETSCEWADEEYSEAPSKRFGSCYWWDHLYASGERKAQKRDLLRVHLRPYRIDLATQEGEKLFAGGEAVINCE